MNGLEHPEEKPKKPPFEEVYRRYYQEAVYFVMGKLGNMHDAEDLVGDAFCYCFQNYEKYDPERSSIGSWLYLIINSRIKNYYRDKKQTVDYSELDTWMFAEEPDMERAVYLEALRTFVAKKLMVLPERQRKVILLRYFHNREFSEIAEEMGTSAGNIRVILSRALDKLEEEFKLSLTDWSIS